MNKLLEQAIAKLKTRPISEQDSIAALILEEIEDDNRYYRFTLSDRQRLSSSRSIR
jgi:hypothetical protein